MVAIHLYVAQTQSAANFVDNNSDPPTTFRCDPRRLWWTDCCRKRRWAKYVCVQVYYDGIRRWCVAGHGCKKGKR